jgi:hypothetical protein
MNSEPQDGLVCEYLRKLRLWNNEQGDVPLLQVIASSVRMTSSEWVVLDQIETSSLA